jgi:hypothetical protein
VETAANKYIFFLKIMRERSERKEVMRSNKV